MTSTRPTIDDADEIMTELREFTHMLPDGSRDPTKVETNRADDNPPNLLRVSVPRKSTETPKLLRAARDHGLEVTDKFQTDRHADDGRVMFLLEPRKPHPEDALAILEELREAFDEYSMTTNREMLNEAHYLVDNYYEELVGDNE